MNTTLVFLAAAVALTALFWWYRRLREDDQLQAFLLHDGALATMASRAHLIDGSNHIPVALKLDAQHITYQNRDLDASIDIGQIDEVEYGSDLVTGHIANGAVLRLRSHGRTFEFILDLAVADRWSHRLPPHRMNEEGVVHAT